MKACCKLILKGAIVLVLSLAMLQQPFLSSHQSLEGHSYVTSPIETIKWLIAHILDLEFASQSEMNSDIVPVSENCPEKEGAESENESTEKDEYNLHDYAFEEMKLFASMQTHLSHSPNLDLIAYWGKIPTPPPEA